MIEAIDSHVLKQNQFRKEKKKVASKCKTSHNEFEFHVEELKSNKRTPKLRGKCKRGRRRSC